MDGVICIGPWIEPDQRTHETYMKMEPYDSDTLAIFKDLCISHECYIMTARKYSKAARSIQEWLSKNEFWLSWPAGIITGIRASEKYHLAGCMYCDLIVDDSPQVWQCARTSGGTQILLMDNPDWEENQQCTDFKDGVRHTYLRVRSWKELGERIASINSRLIQKS